MGELYEGELTVLEPIKDPNYVVTPYIQDIVDYALSYLKADFPINFSGPAGTGKSALAMYVASCLKRPIVMIHGDEEFSTSDLVGGEFGYSSRRLRDQYIHSVIKTEEEVNKIWVDHRLTTACKYGFTLVYDEFTRSKPEANNVLLTILEEKMLEIQKSAGENYIKVDPNFRAIFTSNPEEYAGVHKAQDALRDRMVTINLGHFDKETEIAIIRKIATLDNGDASKIVNIVREFRMRGKFKFAPSIRDSIKIAKTLKTMGTHPSKKNGFFNKVCLHVLTSEEHVKDLNKAKSENIRILKKLIEQYC